MKEFAALNQRSLNDDYQQNHFHLISDHYPEGNLYDLLLEKVTIPKNTIK